MKILFLIRSLETGGAERQLVVLANELQKRGYDVHVAVFYAGGPLEKDLDVPIHFLNKVGRWDIPAFLLRLRKLVTTLAPDIVHGYLGTANLLTSLLKLSAPSAKTVWGIRASDMDMNRYGVTARLHYRAEAMLSSTPDMIIANSEAGRTHAQKQGFRNDSFNVVHNGVDTVRYAPDTAMAQQIRREFSIDDQTPLIVQVARIDPMKDHPTFLKAAACLLKQHPNARFLCVGGGNPEYTSKMKQLSVSLGLSGNLTWTGERHDTTAIYNAADMVCLASAFGEGFPNVLGEAMACGTPCVTTDVGDAALVVGESGIVINRRDPDALCQAMNTMIVSGPAHLPRQRVIDEFSITRMVDKTEALLLSLLNG